MGDAKRKIEPTLDEPTSDHAIEFQKDFNKKMIKRGINLNEVDKMLNEKEQSLKKKIFNLSKMEALVHSDPKLSAVYDEMAQNGEEKYGYHYNETIMNIIFNDYVLNSSKYLQKYKQAIPKEKKRRDKSGINKLRKDAGEIEKKREQMKKEKAQKQQKVNESTPAANAGAYFTKAGDTESHEANQIDTDKEWEELNNPEVSEIAKEKKMKDKSKSKKNPVFDKTNFVGGSDAKPTYPGGKITKNPNNIISEGVVDDLDTAKNMAQQTSKEEGVVQHVNLASNGKYVVSDWYDDDSTVASFENGRELNESNVDETSTTGSVGGAGMGSGGYATPRAWSTKGDLTDNKKKNKKEKPYYKGGKVVGESNYLTDPSGFEKYFNMLNENFNQSGLITTIDQYKQLVQQRRAEGRKIDDNDFKKIAGKALYAIAEKLADRLVPGGMGWDSLPDTNSLWDYIDENGGMSIKELKEAVKEAVNDRLSEEGFDLDMFEGKMNEKAKSEAQQQAAGIALSAKRGETDVEDLKGAAKSMYDSMSAEELEDFAETKHKGLPKHVDEMLSLHDTVEYVSDRKGEEPFEMHDAKWEFVNAKYPDGKIDIGVYRYGQDVVYDYNKWREEMGIDKPPQINEKSESEAQRKAAGAALAAKRGEMDASELYGAAKDMYDSMSEDELEDYASGVKEEKIYEKKWSKDVDVDRGKMHRLLNVPDDEDIEDHYNSGKKLAQDLIDKVGREEAAGMINFAANINSEHNIYDDAQDWLDKTGDKENQDEAYHLKEDHLTDRKDKIMFIINGMMALQEPHEDIAAMHKFLDDQASDEEVNQEYLGIEKVLRDAGIEPKTIDINEIAPAVMALGGAAAHGAGEAIGGRVADKVGLEEHHLSTREEKLDFIAKAAPKLMPITIFKSYFDMLKNSDDEQVNDAYLKAEKILKEKGIDPTTIMETMIEDNPESMKMQPPITSNQGGGEFPSGMQIAKGPMAENYEKLLDEYNKDILIFENIMKKLKGMNEEKKPSALVLKDRLGKDNQKNFKKDLKRSGTKEIVDTMKELEWEDQQTEVGKDPKKLYKDIEKEELKNTDGEAFENEGNSTNNEGDEIPKRNLTDDEANEVDLYRKGLGDYIYDNEPDERYKERMKRDMGEKEYEKREARMEFNADAPMYNKDSQPVDDGIEKVQFDKSKTKWNERMGIKESSLTGKYVDELGKTRLFDFSTVDVQEIKAGKSNAFFNVDLNGLGNTYDSKVLFNEGVVKAINEWNFYTDGKNVFVEKSGVQKLDESEQKEEKSPVNEQFEKMKHLLGYDSSSFTNTKNNKGTSDIIKIKRK